MPTIFEPKDLPVTELKGLKITMLANSAMLGTNALQVEHITLMAGEGSPSYEAIDAERFLYVIRGAGNACVGESAHSLSAESVLWLEQGDAFYLEAGAHGLEVLYCRAPSGE